MRRLILTTAFLVALSLPAAAPPVVHAEEFSWTEDTSKQGLEGFEVCTASATATAPDGQSNTVNITPNVGPDESQPRASEIAWQRQHCALVGTDQVVGVFRYRYGAEIDRSIVRVRFR